MIFYKDDYTIRRVLEAKKSPEQILIQKYTGSLVSNDEAAPLWERILDHKWYISEVLGRDVGLKVATIDYVENFDNLRVKKQRSFLPGIHLGMPTNAASVV